MHCCIQTTHRKNRPVDIFDVHSTAFARAPTRSLLLRSRPSPLSLTARSMPLPSPAAASPTATQLLIDGAWRDAADGQTFAVIDPRSGDKICDVALAGAADIDVAVAAARRAFDEGPWPKMSGRARGRVLFKFADLLEQHADELAQLETLHNGKPLALSRDVDIPLVIDFFRYFAGWADKVHGKTIPTDGDFFSYTLHEPVGVVGAIVPWNFPLLMVRRAWRSALLLLRCSLSLTCRPPRPRLTA